ncbi:MAG: SLBB domain-containing protein [Chitinispirillaceae bacterium]
MNISVRCVFWAIVFCCPVLLFSQSSFMYRNNTGDLELIPVVIQGGGVKAGTYYVPPALRVYDIIKMASVGENPDLLTLDCRSVMFTAEGLTAELDILKYLSLGDFSHNPFVKPGSVIQLKHTVRFVHLHGELQGSVLEKIPVRRGEKAGELLSLYTLTSRADTSNIVLFRDGEGSRRYSYSEIRDVVLENRDFISVLPRKDVPRHAAVKVSGEAASPGVYPVIHGETTISRILAQAGGATAQGDISRAYLIRKTKIKNNSSESLLEGQNNVRPEVTGGFKYLFASRDYAIIPASEEGTLLEDGDEIIIPSAEHCVYVSGCVKKPGAYPYVKGRKVSFYIDLAGGYTRSADKPNIKVITPFTDDAYSISVPEHLSVGDIVMVPEAQEDKWVKRWSPILSAAATVISSVSIIVGLMGVAER